MRSPNALKTSALVSGTAAATALLIQACGGGAVAQSAAEATDPIIGLWDADITITDCTTGASKFSFKGHTLMSVGGTMANGGDALGTWTKNVDGTYTAQFEFEVLDSDQNHVGWQRAKSIRTLAADGKTYTAKIVRAVIDNNDVATPNGCATEAGKRFAGLG